MRKILAALTLSAILPLASLAQTATPAQTEAAAKLEKDAVELLRDTSVEVGRLRLAENRISFNSELASLMWFHDEKEAKVMYTSVIADFRQLLTQFDMQMNSAEVQDDDPDMIGGIFGGYGRSKMERKFQMAMAVRQQIAMSMAEHAPDQAFDFFYESQSLVSNPEFRKQIMGSDKYFEGQLLTQIASTDAAKAVEYGKLALKTGVDMQQIELLKKIYAKDPDKGIEFGAAILSKLKTDKIKESYTYVSLLEYAGSNLEASKKKGKKPIYDASDVREIADQFGQYLLDGDNDLSESTSYIEMVEKYSPGRGAQLRAKAGKHRSSSNTASNRYTVSTMSTNSNVAYAGNSNSGLSSNSSQDPELRAREARAAAEKEVMENIKDLGTKSLPKEERDKVVAQARALISKTAGKDKKITALSLLAAQVAHAGDKELADEIMKDAERLIDPQPKNYQDFLLTWMVVSGYAETNPDKAFPLLENAILRANDTIAAAVKIGEFIDTNDDYVTDGEVQVGMFGGSMVRGLTSDTDIASGTIRSLATADFAKTRALTNSFDRLEARILARMLVLRAVLDKTPPQTPDAAKDDSIEITNAP